ncbi:hypothetical protein [Marinobacter sp.]|uniref:hypothetical protein n=1 Tax=Marinobacter sp. TaxID=50741 RepID=UPI003A8F63A2
MTIPTDDKLKLAIWLYKNLEDTERVQSRELKGALPKGVDFDEIENALDEFEMASVGCRKETRTIQFSAPSSDGFFAWSMEDLLKNPSRSRHAPTRFYIADLDYLHPDQKDSMPNQVKGYFQRLKLIDALQPPFADYKYSAAGPETLVFISEKKLEISINISASELDPTPAIDKLIEDYIFSTEHKNHKHTIIRTCITDLFAATGSKITNISISDLFKEADILLEDAKDNYDLFISEFSFKKIKNEIEREKLEFTIKLNTVFSSIQNQLLAIPVALVLVGGQMENTGNWNQKNIVIWLGGFVFAFLLSLLVRNQKNTLTAVRQEIDQQWKKIQSDHRPVADRFSDLYWTLEERHKHQTWLIRIVDALVAASLFAGTAYLLWISVPHSLGLSAAQLSLIGIPIYYFGGKTYNAIAQKTAARRSEGLS